MELFKNRLNDAIATRKISAAELSRISGVNEGAISQYRKGAYKATQENLERLAKALNVSIPWLMGADVPMREQRHSLQNPKIADNVVTLPVIGEIAAGFDNIAMENWSGDTIEVPISYLRGYTAEDFIVLTVIGDSMYPEYKEGDKVVIKKQPYPDYSGQIGAVIYEDELSTLKKIEFPMDKSWLKLVPLNLVSHSPQKYEGEALDHIHYLGVPKWVIREVKE